MLRGSLLISAMAIAVCAGPVFAAKNDSDNNAKTDNGSGVRVTEVRDWSQVDKDRDGYVTPAEMESYLQQYAARKANNNEAASATEDAGGDGADENSGQ